MDATGQTEAAESSPVVHTLDERAAGGVHPNPSDSLTHLPPTPEASRTMTLLIQFFRVLSSCMSIMMILSPSPTIYKIYKTGSTGHATILPLVSMLANCHLWMMYGYLDHNLFPIFGTFVVGELISLSYIIIFYRSTSDRSAALKTIGVFAVALLAVSTYAVVGGLGYTNQTRSKVTSIVGYIGIVTAIVLYSSPFEKIHQVLKHCSGVFIPIHMVIAALVNNSSWCVYSALTSDWFIFGPNAFMLVLSLSQITVYLVFHPSTHPLEPSCEDPSKDIEMALDAPDLQHGKIHTDTPTYVPVKSPLAPFR